MFKVEFYKDGNLVAILPLHQQQLFTNYNHEGEVEVQISDFRLKLYAGVLCTQVIEEA